METWSSQLKLKSPFFYVAKQYAQNGIISIINRKGSKMRLFFTFSCTKQTILVFYNHTAARYFPCHLWTFMRNSLIDFTVLWQKVSKINLSDRNCVSFSTINWTIRQILWGKGKLEERLRRIFQYLMEMFTVLIFTAGKLLDAKLPRACFFSQQDPDRADMAFPPQWAFKSTTFQNAWIQHTRLDNVFPTVSTINNKSDYH